MNTSFGIKAVPSSLMERLEVDGAMIEYQVQGNGEPVLLIPPGVTIDGLGLPLLSQPQLTSRFLLIHYRRRGYMGSSLGTEPTSIAREASDAAALLRHLGVKNAHLAGHSIGGLIALQLAVDVPDLVHSLALLEPPIRIGQSGKASVERVILPMMNAYRSGNKRAAIEIFCDSVFGPNWQPIVEGAVPGGVERAFGNADAFVQDLQAIQAWQFEPTQAVAISQPVLSVVGVRSAPFAMEVRGFIHSWFPQTEDFDAQSTHLLQMQDPQGVAQGLAEFFSRHPVTERR